ncbi:recombination endonuclease subunit [Yersinia phage JC221]|nr:recombination endonuclease subunit [Yersinia phage JC221]
MSYLLVGDLHAGLRNDNQWNEDNLYRVFKQLVEYCKANKIDTVFQSGDFFDVRKATTQTTMNFVREKLVPLLAEAKVTMYVLVGNHDTQFKNKIRPNAPRELLSQYEWFRVVDEPETVEIWDENDNQKWIDLIPWICEENSQQIFDFIKKSTSEFCLGHFELSGYYFYKNSKSDHGLEPDFLKKYQRVFSGHYHHANEGDNVFYIGTPLTMSANDEEETRGFYEFNGKPELAFIANPDISHRRIVYPAQKDVDLSLYKNTSVRLIVNSIDNDLGKFQTELEKVAHELSIIDNLKTESDIDTDFEIESSYSLMIKYVDNMNHSDEDKAEIKKLIQSLHTEAVNA